MYKLSALLSILLLTSCVYAQSRSTKDWVNFGSSHVNKWLQLSPETMGPNALPVPLMNYGLVGEESSLEIGTHYHQMKGDTAVNTYFNYNWILAKGRARLDVWGYPSETYRMTNKVRDIRQIYWDDPGWATDMGDLWFSTHVQLVKNHKYIPDVVVEITFKTTTGINDHARYTDAPLHYFALAIGRSFNIKSAILDEVRIGAMGGFYAWQTNKVESAQDEGPLYNFGLILRKKRFSVVNEFGGYNGYDAYGLNGEVGRNNNDPMIIRSKFEWEGNLLTAKLEYQHGFRNYNYETLRLGIVFRIPTMQTYNTNQQRVD